MAKGEKTVTLKFRLDTELEAAVRIAAKKKGESMSRYHRNALQMQLRDYKAPSVADLNLLSEIWRQLVGAGTNLNTLARAVNQASLGQGTDPEYEAMVQCRKDLNSALNAISSIIGKWC